MACSAVCETFGSSGRVPVIFSSSIPCVHSNNSIEDVNMVRRRVLHIYFSTQVTCFDIAVLLLRMERQYIMTTAGPE